MRRLVSVIALICSIIVICASIYTEVRVGQMILRAVSVYVLSYIVLMIAAVLSFTSFIPGDMHPAPENIRAPEREAEKKQNNESESQGNK